MKQTLAAALLLLAAPAIFAAAPAAQSSLSASPSVVMLRGQAGQSTTQQLSLTNHSPLALSFDMIAKDVIVRGGKRIFSDAGALAGSIAATAVFSQKSVTVAPGDTAHVSVTVTIPPNAASRAVVALFHGTTKIDQGGVKATASLGTLLTFTLSDRLSIDAAPLQVAPPTASSNLTVAQHCANSGSEPVVARGVLAIVDGSGRMLGKTAVPAYSLFRSNVSPGRYRALLTYDLDAAQPVISSAEFEVR